MTVKPVPHLLDVTARGAAGYLFVSGDRDSLMSMLEALCSLLAEGSDEPVGVLGAQGRSPRVMPLLGVSVRATSGAVRIEVMGTQAAIIGAPVAITRLFDQMGQLLRQQGPHHWEILHVFEEGFEHLDPDTHIDLVVTAPRVSGSSLGR